MATMMTMNLKPNTTTSFHHHRHLYLSSSSQTTTFSSSISKYKSKYPNNQRHRSFLVRISSSSSSSLHGNNELLFARKLVDEFDPKIPLEKAQTPPSSWYTDPSFLSLELDRLFYRGWQAVGSYLSLTY